MGNDKFIYDRRKARGQCTQCGAVLPPRWGYLMCARCRMQRMSPERIRIHEEKAREPKVIVARKRTLDEMSVEAKRRGISYGKLQSEETIDRLRARDSANLTIKRWGRDGKVGI